MMRVKHVYGVARQIKTEASMSVIKALFTFTDTEIYGR